MWVYVAIIHLALDARFASGGAAIGVSMENGFLFQKMTVPINAPSNGEPSVFPRTASRTAYVMPGEPNAKVTASIGGISDSILVENRKALMETTTVRIIDKKINPASSYLELFAHIGCTNRYVESGACFKQACVTFHAENAHERISTNCVVDGSNQSCIAKLLIPVTWWPSFTIDELKTDVSKDYVLALQPIKQATLETRLVTVSYEVQQVVDTMKCGSETGPSIPDPRLADGLFFSDHHNPSKQTMYTKAGTVPLILPPLLQFSRQQTADDMWSVLTAGGTLYHGEIVLLPIQIQSPEYINGRQSITKFRIRMTSTVNCKIVSVEPNALLSKDEWSVRIPNKNDQVLVSYWGYNLYEKIRLRKELFYVSVIGDVKEPDVSFAELNFDFSYMDTEENVSDYFSFDNLTIQWNLKSDYNSSLIATATKYDLINTAVFDDHVEVIPIKIYVLSEQGVLSHIKRGLVCTSKHSSLIDVDKNCSAIFLSGIPVDGFIGAEILITTSSSHSESTMLRTTLRVNVWCPEDPITIWIGDPIISPIDGWRVFKDKEEMQHDFNPDGDWLNEIGCQNVYKYSDIKVFTRFRANSDLGIRYLDGDSEKGLMDITTRVIDQLTVSDDKVAVVQIVGTDRMVLYGKQKGVAKLMVRRNSTSKEWGSAGFRVSGLSESTVINAVYTAVTARIRFSRIPSADDLHSTQVLASAWNVFSEKEQRGVLSTYFGLSDGSFVALSDYLPSTYNTSLTRIGNVVDIDQIDEKSGVLQISTNIDGTDEVDSSKFHCKNKSKVHEVKILLYSVDLIEPRCHNPKGDFMSVPMNNVEIFFACSTDSKFLLPYEYELNVMKLYTKTSMNVVPVPELAITLGTRPNELPSPSNVFQGNSSTGEVVLYALLGVFGVALAIIAIHCFADRRKTSKTLGGTSTSTAIFSFEKLPNLLQKWRRGYRRGSRSACSSAREWVWIDRDALIESSINTGCSTNLLPEEEFESFNRLQEQTMPSSPLNTMRNGYHYGATPKIRRSLHSRHPGESLNRAKQSSPFPPAPAPQGPPWQNGLCTGHPTNEPSYSNNSTDSAMDGSVLPICTCTIDKITRSTYPKIRNSYQEPNPTANPHLDVKQAGVNRKSYQGSEISIHLSPNPCMEVHQGSRRQYRASSWCAQRRYQHHQRIQRPVPPHGIVIEHSYPNENQYRITENPLVTRTSSCRNCNRNKRSGLIYREYPHPQQQQHPQISYHDSASESNLVSDHRNVVWRLKPLHGGSTQRSIRDSDFGGRFKDIDSVSDDGSISGRSCNRELEWDRESLGLDDSELRDYISGLRESVA